MNCSDPKIGELITLYEFDGLARDDRRKFEAHLLSCDYCFQNLYALSPVIERMRGNPRLFLSTLKREPFWREIKQKIAAIMPAIRIQRRGWIAIPATAIVVLCFLLLRPAPELSDLAHIEPAPYRSLQIKSGAATTAAERFFEAGMAAYVQKDYAGAIKQLALAARQDSTNVIFHFYLGLCYLLSNHVEPAIEHLQRTIALGGNAVLEKAYWYLGNAWLLQEDRAHALEAFQKVADMEGDFQWEAKEIITKIEATTK